MNHCLRQFSFLGLFLVKQWMLCPTVIEIIQNIFDCRTQLWTICELIGTYNPVLRITFFNDEKFNVSFPTPVIDEIVQNQISVERFFTAEDQRTLLVEYLNLNTNKIIWKEKICFNRSYQNEYEEIRQFYQQQPSLISIIETSSKNITTINIFGYGKTVTELLRKLEDLFKKYRPKKFAFTQLSTTEVNAFPSVRSIRKLFSFLFQIDCLSRLCHSQLKMMEKQSDDCWVKFDLDKSIFYAPEYEKDQVESEMKNLFAKLERQTIKTEEFYYDTYQQIESYVKNVAKKFQCYPIVTKKTKVKSFPIIKESSNAVTLPSFGVESIFNSFSSSPCVVCQAKFPNGSIEASVGDVTQQQVKQQFQCILHSHSLFRLIL